MPQLLRLLTSIYMCLAIGFGGVAHAAEDAGAVTTEFCAVFGCADEAGDDHTDDQPGAADDHPGEDHGKDGACTCHAHGGCHGHHQLGSVKDHVLLLQHVVLALPQPFHRDMLPLGIRALTLRPPIV